MNLKMEKGLISALLPGHQEMAGNPWEAMLQVL
jgi:hypothetical protein